MPKHVLVVLQHMTKRAELTSHPMSHSTTNRQFFPQRSSDKIQVPFGQIKAAKRTPHFQGEQGSSANPHCIYNNIRCFPQPHPH